MSAEAEVRRLCAALWQELIVTRTVYELPRPSTRRGRRVGGPVVHVIHVGRSMLSHGREVGRGATADAAWSDALAALPQRIEARVLEIDREVAAMSAERARIVAALSSLDWGAL